MPQVHWGSYYVIVKKMMLVILQINFVALHIFIARWYIKKK